MLDNNFKIKLEMLSDWQIGAGAGIPGSTDELISKDVDGFPQVPAKTLVGIWRDALERLCDSLGGSWSNWVETIFGNQPNEKGANPTKKPVSAILSTQPARISENLRAKISGFDKTSRAKYKQALTFVKVGVKIDGDSGTSETEALRFEEMGRIGSVLEADVELDWDYFDNNQKEIASALLILSAKLVERIGGKRRRGAGKCDFKVFDLENKEQSITDAKDKLVANKHEAIALPVKPEKDNEKSNEDKSEQNGEWQTREYTLTLETPVSIVSAVLGNVSETLDFIPGTYLISHFVKHFGEAIFTAIQANNFQISPATICIDGNRSFPVPNVIYYNKSNGGFDKPNTIYNKLEEREKIEDTTFQKKNYRLGFVGSLGDENKLPIYEKTPQTILMHNAVDDEAQRPTTDVVGVYSREAIRAETVLKGEIRYKNLQLDFSSLKDKVRIGTSKKDGGLAKIRVESAKPFKAKSVSKTNEIIVYLASDIMLRNDNLRQSNSAECLAKFLDLENEEITFEQIQARRIESWQTGWGFPHPTLTLIQAGSVIRIKTDKKIDFSKIEAEGIGERRGEGYGQVIFNPPILTNEINDWKQVSKNSTGLSEEEKSRKQAKIDSDFADEVRNHTSLNTFAKLIEETAWREEIKLAVSKIAADDATKENARDQIFGFKGLNMSQIGGLRSVIMRLQSKSDVSLVTDWLNHLESTKNRFDKWEKWRIDKVRHILENDNVWTKLGNNFNEPKSLELENNLKDKLWAEAVKSLFYACQHAHKRDTEDK